MKLLFLLSEICNQLFNLPIILYNRLRYINRYRVKLTLKRPGSKTTISYLDISPHKRYYPFIAQVNKRNIQ